jgi:hypothetical protein
MYPKTLEDWKKQCIKYNINSSIMYRNDAAKYNLPLMPQELYKNFTTLYNEFIVISPNNIRR